MTGDDQKALQTVESVCQAPVDTGADVPFVRHVQSDSLYLMYLSLVPALVVYSIRAQCSD